jgi:hypothetical protein
MTAPLWTVVEIDDDEFPFALTSEGFTVAKFVSERGALLAAAQPQLLEAAELALRIAEEWIENELSGTSFLKTALEELDPVRAAVAKARGHD